ncbi:MAG: oligoendopeptidase F [Simkaniaceae bacterium]
MSLSRKEVEAKDKWNIEKLYSAKEVWQKELKSLNWDEIQTFKGKIEGVDQLEALLKKYFHFSERLEKVWVYAHLRSDEDVACQENKEAFDQANLLYHRFSAETAWIEPEILKIESDQLKKWSEKLPSYRFFLDRLLRLKAHTLSEKEESLISLAERSLETSRATFSLLNNADLKFEKALDKEVTIGLYQLYMRSQDRSLREAAYKSLFNRYGEFGNTFTELLSGHISTHVFNAKARGYSSSLEAALYPNKIDLNVYHSLIDTAKKHLKSFHSYIALRKKLMGVDELYLYDLYAPIVEDVQENYCFEEAVKLIIESVAPLGDDYQNQLRKGLVEERWVDRFENKGKRSGAYSSGCYGSSPFILMNYKGLLDDVMTLTHEAGHSMHSFYSQKHQPYQTFRYTIFVAEVASTFNEELLFRHLLKNIQDPKLKAYLLNQKIDGIRATFFRQVLFADFELKIHELAEKGIPLTPHNLKKIYIELNREYYGKALKIDDFLPNEYLRIPHFYSNFYVYQYATGISASLSLVERVLEEGKPAREDYLNFLKSGGSDYPIALLKKAGCDLTTSQPFESLIQYFSSLVSEFETIMLALNSSK